MSSGGRNIFTAHNFLCMIGTLGKYYDVCMFKNKTIDESFRYGALNGRSEYQIKKSKVTVHAQFVLVHNNALINYIENSNEFIENIGRVELNKRYLSKQVG